jgi:prevent-host-death family protein
MTEPKATDETITTTDVSRNPGAVFDRVRLQSKLIEVTRNGTPAAVVVPVDWHKRAAAVVDAPEISGNALRDALYVASAAAQESGALFDATAYRHMAILIAANSAVVIR